MCNKIINSSYTVRATPECKHANGVFTSVTFFKIFSKRVFVCTDCGNLLTLKEYRKHKKHRFPVPIIDKGNFD